MNLPSTKGGWPLVLGEMKAAASNLNDRIRDACAGLVLI
jgi:hypothetical protein